VTAHVSSHQERSGDVQDTNAGGITITGMNETMLHLKNFHRDIYDVLAKQTRDILKRTSGAAASRYPGGAWTISVGAARWPSGQVSTAGGSSRGFGSWSDAPPGVKASIFDTMGRRSAGDTPQARATIASLTARYGAPQRFLWPAWMSNRRESMQELERALEQAQDALTARIGG
jgi:hypothetical protein